MRMKKEELKDEARKRSLAENGTKSDLVLGMLLKVLIFSFSFFCLCFLRVCLHFHVFSAFFRFSCLTRFYFTFEQNDVGT